MAFLVHPLIFFLLATTPPSAWVHLGHALRHAR